jgi:ATP-binding cassette subfamily F protein uup
VRQRPAAGKEEKIENPSTPRLKSKTKLSYKETRELESLPKEIEALEAEQLALGAKMASPDYYEQPPDVLRADQARSAEIERLLMEKLERWEALEAATR